MSTKPPGPNPPITELEIKPVELKVALTVSRAGKVESCCNYDIAGKAGNLLLVLPPMTHIQDMPR